MRQRTRVNVSNLRMLNHMILSLSLLLIVVYCNDVRANQERIIVKNILVNPESVFHDLKYDRYIVSNMNGTQHSLKDNKGFISLISPSGAILEARWIEGGKNGVELNKPTGMAVVGDALWVADYNTIRSFDLRSGKPLKDIVVEGAQCLNDLVADQEGNLYISDCGLDDTFSATYSDAIWKLSEDGQLEQTYSNTAINKPNGLAIDLQGRLNWVNLASKGELATVVSNTKVVRKTLPIGMLDGLAVDKKGRFYISSWDKQQVLLFDNRSLRVIKGVSGVADLSIDYGRNRLLLPLLYKNELHVMLTKDLEFTPFKN